MKKTTKAAQMPPSITLRLSRGRSVKITWRPRQRVSSLLVKLLTKALAVFLPLSMGYAQAADVNALPTGGQVTAGSATINQTGNTLNINQASQKAALNWQTFNIGTNGTVNFVQPNSNAVALNRIGGNSASEIYGHLNANGQVFLMNPNGILFGRGSQVNVGGIVATTMQLGDADFLAGNYNFSNAGAGSVANYGLINATNSVALLGSDVTNQGSIFATTASLVSGNTVALDVSTDGLIRARVVDAAVQANIANSGDINATQVTLSAGQAKDTLNRVVNNSGVIKATGFSSLNGEITLQGGTTLNSGTLDATSATGNGGTVHMLGQHVGLIDSGSIDVSGATGGGTILVGGDYQGKNASIENAEVTYVGAQTTLKADATQNGNGGKVIVWADDTTRAYGNISAQGGVLGGDGGFVETSGKQWLGFNAQVNTGAVVGKQGSLLLDPKDIIVGTTPDINDDGTTGDDDTGNILSSDYTTNTISQITASQLGSLLTSTNVSLAATRDITIASAVSNAGPSFALTLNAGRDINLNANVLLGSNLTAYGALNLTAGGQISQAANARLLVGQLSVTSVGDVTLNQQNSTTSLSADITGSGSFSYMQADGISFGSGPLSIGHINTTTGNISLINPAAYYLNVNASSISSTSGNITLNSQGGLNLGSTAQISTSGRVDVSVHGGPYNCNPCGGIVGGQSITMKVDGLTVSGLWGNLTSLGDIQLTTATADTDIAVGGSTDINSRGLTYIYIPADMRFASTPTKLIIGDSANLGTVRVFASPTFLPTNGVSLKLQGGTVEINAPLSMGTRQLEIESKNAITQTAAITTTGTLTANAATGINLSNTGNNVGTFTAFNTSTGGIDFYNNGSVILGGITNNASSAYINIGSSGAISQTAAITTTGSLTTNAVTGINLSNTSNSVHSFAAQNTNTNNITFNNVGDIHFGAIANGASLGDITLGSGGSIYQDNNITANNGDIQLSASDNVTVNGLIDAGVGTVGVSAGLNITDDNGAGNNIKASYVGLTAGDASTGQGSIDIDTKVQQLLVENLDANSTSSVKIRNTGSPLLVNAFSSHHTNTLEITNNNSIQIGHIGGAVDTTITATGTTSDIQLGLSGCSCSTILSDGNVTLTAGRDILIYDDHISAGGAVTATAGNNIMLANSYIEAGGSVTANANGATLGNGSITLNADTAPTYISAGTGMSLTAVGDISLIATDSYAQVYAHNGEQIITAANIYLTAGSATLGSAYAEIEHAGAGNQIIDINNGGDLILTGGTVGNQNQARIDYSTTDSLGYQQIGSDLNRPIIEIAGLSGGTYIPSAGSFDYSNNAEINSDTKQIIYADSILMTAGSDNASAIISASNQEIHVTHDVDLTGGASSIPTINTGHTDQFDYSGGPYYLASVAAIGDKNNLNQQTLEIGGTLTLTGGSGSSGLAMVGSLRGNAPGSIKAGSIVLNSTLGGSLALLGGAEDIVVTNTFNNSGGVISGNSWSIWALNPTKITGCVAGSGCHADFAQYGLTYGSTANPALGKGLLYSAPVPALTSTMSGAVSKPYDGTTAISLLGAIFGSITGAVYGDTVSLSGGVGTLADPNEGTAKLVTATGMTVTAVSSSATGSIPVYGYSVNSTSATIGSVTAAVITDDVQNAIDSIHNGSETSTSAEDAQAKQEEDEIKAPEKVLVALNFVDDPNTNKENPIETEKPKGRTLQCSVNK